ncbi:hypothetical protein B0H17DRAFT_1332863 [Mycena rosella]|uniref:Uncharacterized protein n=1 Tax=Mycena rosella TaxID=1033263 RepID=A0AAD7D9E5_MYCRO|nr:hypothetical protein B0H17DRAFT_1332863 [Mycena rosella]
MPFGSISMLLRPPRPLRAFVALIPYSYTSLARRRGPQYFASGLRGIRCCLERLQDVEMLRSPLLLGRAGCSLRGRISMPIGLTLQRRLLRQRRCLLSAGWTDATLRTADADIVFLSASRLSKQDKTSLPRLHGSSLSSPQHPHFLLLKLPLSFLVTGATRKAALGCRRRAASLLPRALRHTWPVCEEDVLLAAPPAFSCAAAILPHIGVRPPVLAAPPFAPHASNVLRCAVLVDIAGCDIHEHPVNAELYIYASIRADLDGVPVGCGAISSCGVHTILSPTSFPGLPRAFGRGGCLGAGER